MPFYDYKCNSCTKVFEVIHGMGEKPAGIKCEFCGAVNVNRVFYPIGTMKAGKDFSDAPSSSNRSCSSCASTSCSTCR